MLNILIWDKLEPPPSFNGKILLWNAFNDNENLNNISIPKIIEENDLIIKKNFLEIINNLGEKKINNISFKDQLLIRKNFSYLWMNLIFEKCNFSKSPNINDIVKIIAFEIWLNNQNIESISLCSDKQELGEIFASFCIKKNILFNNLNNYNHNLKDKKYPKKYFFVHKILIFLYLIYTYISNLRLNKINLKKVYKTNDSITLVSYFLNFDKSLAKKGVFKSDYWGPLIDLLKKKKIKTNWIHIYSRKEGFSNVSDTHNLLSSLNNNQDLNYHLTQYSCLSIKNFIKILKDSFYLTKVYSKLNINEFQISFFKSSFNYWPLFKSDFAEAFNYKSLIINLLYVNYFEELSSLLVDQKKIIYLQENQNWEIPLLHFLKKNSKKKLIGFPHASIRFWDLRYFYAPNFLKKNNQNLYPRPDFIAVNGPISKKLLSQISYPKNELIEVESLRYFHLLDSSVPKKINIKNNNNLPIILILGDYLEKNNYRLLKLLDLASKFLPANINFIYKPHPSQKNFNYKFKSIKLNVSNSHINLLLNKSDVVYSSNQTSASLDAYYSGVPVIISLFPEILNLSPVRNLPNAIFIHNNPNELAKEILNNLNKKYDISHKDHFYLNKDLKYWNKLL
jgi:surface carbohydrate biosynthesis protein (TIGR04326 family)